MGKEKKIEVFQFCRNVSVWCQGLQADYLGMAGPQPVALKGKGKKIQRIDKLERKWEEKVNL